MNDISLWQALELWFSGERLDGYSMLSIPFLVWGRIAKALTILGGLVVVLDYVGPRRLSDWGHTLQTRPLHRLRQWVVSSNVSTAVTVIGFFWISGLVLELLDSLSQPAQDALYGALDKQLYGWRGNTVFLLGILLCVGAYYSHRAKRRLATRILAGVGVVAIVVPAVQDVIEYTGGILAMILGAVALVLILLVLGAFFDAMIWLADPLVIKPIVWALDREAPGQPVRWAGFLAVLFGQMLDLLAS